MITHEQHELLKELINSHECPGKASIRFDLKFRTMVFEYDEINVEWFNKMLELMPK